MANNRRAMARRYAQRVWIETTEEQPGYWFAPNCPNHGTFNGYNNWYCRDPECTAANAEKIANDRKADQNKNDSVSCSTQKGGNGQGSF